MSVLRGILLVIVGLSGGVVIASAYVAFMISIGIIRNVAIKTKEVKHYKIYEVLLSLGLISGVMISTFDEVKFSLGIVGIFLIIIIGVFYGIFVGYLAMALTEVFDIIPIFREKTKLKYSINIIIFSIAFGKLAGALVYWLVPGFYTNF